MKDKPKKVVPRKPIEPKPKKCKGIGIAFGFDGCGKPTLYREHGLGKMCGCYSKWLLETDAGKLKMQRAIIQVSKPRLELEKAEKEHKEKPKLKLSKERTKQVTHDYVRTRDKNKPCISCDCEWNPEFQAGHFYKSETFETLKYHLDNIHGQCVQCNIFKDGNFDNYSLRLPKRIGQEKYNALVKLAEVDKHFEKVWDLDKLQEVRNKIKLLTRF